MLRLRRTAPTGGNRQYGRYGYRPYPGYRQAVHTVDGAEHLGRHNTACAE